MAGERTDLMSGLPNFAESHYTLTNLSGSNETEFSYPRFGLIFLKVRGIRELVLMILCFISAVTCALNSLTIALFIRSKKRAKYSDYFILNLAFADLSVGAIAMPINIMSLVFDTFWIFDNFCMVVLASVNVCTALSMLSLLLITVDRYLISAWPHFYRNQTTKMLVWVMIFFPWVFVSLVVVLPFTLFHLFVGGIDVERHYCYYICQGTEGRNMLLIIIALMIVPVIGIPVLNIKIYQSAKHRFQGRRCPVGSAVSDSFSQISISLSPKHGPSFLLAARSRSIKPVSSKVFPSFTCYGERPGTAAVISAIIETDEGDSANTSPGTDRACDISGHCGNRAGRWTTLRKRLDAEGSLFDGASPAPPSPVRARRRSASFSQGLTVGVTIEGFRPGQMKRRRTRRFSSDSSARGFRRSSILSIDIDSQDQMRRDCSKRFLKTLLQLVIVFLLCCTPYTFLAVIHAAISPSGSSAAHMGDKCLEVAVDQNLSFFFVWLLLLNSALNPWLYPRKHSYFRNAFTEEFKCTRKMKTLLTITRSSNVRADAATE